jgi:hypothetical protein
LVAQQTEDDITTLLSQFAVFRGREGVGTFDESRDHGDLARGQFVQALAEVSMSRLPHPVDRDEPRLAEVNFIEIRL